MSVLASPRRPVSTWRAALAGVLAAGAAVAVGELLAGLIGGVRSLVIAVGDQVIDLVPSPVKEFAIATFGTNDKVALLVGIGVVLTLFAAGIGFAGARRFRFGALGVLLFGAIASVAAVNQSFGVAAWLAVVPAVVAALAARVALWFLLAPRRRRPAGAVAPAAGAADAAGAAGTGARAPGGFDRRGFLRAAGIVAVLAGGAATAGRLLQSKASAAASRAALMLRPADRTLPPIPLEAVTVDVEGMTPFVTPNPAFYRIDTALQVPAIAVDDYRLRVTGMVDTPLEFSFEQLQAMTLVESDITLTCVSNEIGGRLVGNARWLGIPLEDVLSQAGVRDGATQIVGRSVDDWTAGFPVEAAFDGRGAIIAIGMNGEPLPLEHGFPVRLVVPGLYGYVSATKWLTEIELTTFEAFDHYWVSRGWAVKAPIKTASRIDVPAGLATVPAGRVPVAGVAYAQLRGIERVEVQIDDEPWVEARLAEPLNDVTWRQWVYEWDAKPGNHEVRVRATDKTGETQPEERVEPIPDGATGWHSVLVRVTEA